MTLINGPINSIARDIYHYEVKEALIKDGWTITNDPLVLLGKNEGGLQTDLGAEKIITAEKGLTKIAVEVKSFVHPSISRIMDRVTFFKQIILEVLREQVEYFAGANMQGVQFVPITDEIHHHYQLVALGWEGSKRIFNLLYHIDIIGDKIWIQEDHTEDSVAKKLVAKGIPKKDIVLAYFPDFHRKHTEYAVG